MKRIVLISFIAVLAFAQKPPRHDELFISADQQDKDGPKIHLTGHVVIETDVMELRADSADFNTDTMEIAPHGDVHIKLK
jgi:lipopolysaccharide assembly outer membrane protein LptD (OstA)